MFQVTMLTLQHALKHLRRNKCADSNGIVAECFAYGSLEFCEHLFCLPNLLLVHGHLDERKKQTTFSMIPETGDFTKPRNWRPLAILKNITIWPPIVHKRVGVWASNAHARTNMKTRKKKFHNPQKQYSATAPGISWIRPPWSSIRTYLSVRSQ